jgi:hypothetical protein
MSERLDADVRVIMTAEDRASADVKSAVDRINKSYRDFNNQQRAVQRGFALQHRTFSSVSRAISDVGRVAGTATHIFQAWNIMSLRQIETARDLRDAQEQLNRAVAQYGPTSEIARKAAQRFSDTQRQAEAQRGQDIAAYVAMGLQGAGAVGSFARTGTFGKIAGRLGGLRGSAGLGLLGRAGIAGAAGAVAFGAFQSQGGDPVSRAVEQAGGGGITGALDTYVGNPLNRLFGLPERSSGGGKQVTQNIAVHTNEMSVTADDIVNMSDVFGESYQ